jgi:hypothetical protein
MYSNDTVGIKIHISHGGKGTLSFTASLENTFWQKY